ncbi:MAG: GNAT family N-acetyltransferase [Actinobacteria bacterium]|nr:GNAT family N-acetyltransferase [Actinomycetota bacterium]MBW3649997.1 GNAT family N-acetyltransferase [Actinomycetota bacterium]
MLREATAADLDEICALIRELAEYERLADQVNFDRDELAGWLFGDSPRAWVTLAEPDDRPGTVAGMALWHWTFSTFLGRPGIWVEDLVVRPEHRGAGLGRALLASLFERSPGRVEWAVLDWNEPAIAFYRSVGAHVVPGWTRYRWTGDGVAPAR